MKRLMVDIETLDSSGTAAVIAIGACVFDLEGLHEDFSVTIDVEAAKAYGSTSKFTLEWWSTQSEEVRARMFSGTESPNDAVKKFIAFIRRNPVREVWANAPTFDCVILQNLFRQLSQRCPWGFRDERCVRTVYAIGRQLGVDYSLGYSEKGAHDAVVDARNQARAVSIVLRRLDGKLL